MADIKQYNLISLFDDYTHEDGETFSIKKIEIPIIQRDYAQGRKIPAVKRIRERFVKSLKQALLPEGKGITLDFVYGYRNEKGILIPLDGQQRLTTLFLLHWYIARHEDIEESSLEFLHNFSYATRASAREFCQSLIYYKPEFCGYGEDSENGIEYKISEEIIDQEWMPIDWMNDPTIASMLEMLDCLHEHFHETTGLWQQLEAGRISFYFLPIDQMGLTDDLYIKMNSRGKPLTEFEHFKVEWESCIKTVDEELANVVSHKIDMEWTDLLWSYRNVNKEVGENIIDEEFISYFMFLCDIIYYKNWELERKDNILDIAHQLFSNKCENAKDNIEFIIKGFDCWNKVDGDICNMFSTYLANSNSHVTGKALVRMRADEDIDLFRECCAKYGGSLIGGHKRSFSLLRTVLLYTFVFYLMKFEEITEEQFIRRLRIVNNLIKGSEFDIRDRGNTMKNILSQTEYILLNGNLINEDAESGTSFNVNQVKEEQEKVEFIAEHPELAETIFTLEDHDLLNGAIRVLGTENIDLADKFAELFNCDRGLVHCALLTTGDYSMKVTFRNEMGSANRPQNWRDIFRNDLNHIQNTKDVLVKLLRSHNAFTNKILIDIISDFIQNASVMDWRYYLVKYNISLSSLYSMYFWYDYKTANKESYKILMMQTEKSLTGRNHNIFLKAIYDIVLAHNSNAAVRMEEYAYHENGGKLSFANNEQQWFYMMCEDTCFVIYDAETQEKLNEISIEHNVENGRDIVDRVELGSKIIGEYLGFEEGWFNYSFSYTPARPISDDERNVITRSARTLLRVILPNGTTIEHDSAKDTFLEAIKLAGVENVRGLKLEMCNIPLVSSTNNTSYSQVEVEPGAWVITHSNTIDKKRKLEQISNLLDLKWIVKVINS